MIAPKVVPYQQKGNNLVTKTIDLSQFQTSNYNLNKNVNQISRSPPGRQYLFQQQQQQQSSFQTSQQSIVNDQQRSPHSINLKETNKFIFTGALSQLNNNNHLNLNSNISNNLNKISPNNFSLQSNQNLSPTNKNDISFKQASNISAINNVLQKPNQSQFSAQNPNNSILTNNFINDVIRNSTITRLRSISPAQNDSYVSQIQNKMEELGKEVKRLMKINEGLLRDMSDWREKCEQAKQQKQQYEVQNEVLQRKLQDLQQSRFPQGEDKVIQDDEKKVRFLEAELEDLRQRLAEQEENHIQEILQLKTNLQNSIIEREEGEEEDQFQKEDFGKQVQNEDEYQYEQSGSKKEKGILQNKNKKLQEQIEIYELQMRYIQNMDQNEKENILQQICQKIKSQQESREIGLRSQIENLKQEKQRLQDLNETLQNEISLQKNNNFNGKGLKVDKQILEILFENEVEDEEEEDEFQNSVRNKQQREIIKKQFTENEIVQLKIKFLTEKNQKLESELQTWKVQYWNLEKKINQKEDENYFQQLQNQKENIHQKIHSFKTNNHHNFFNQENLFQPPNISQPYKIQPNKNK